MRIPDMSRRIMSGSMLVAVLLVAHAPAFALSVPGYSALTEVGWLDSSAWREKNGGIVNVSSSQQVIFIPLTVNAGFHTVTVATNNPGGGTFYCYAVVADQFGGASDGPSVYPNTGNTTFSLSGTVPSNGSMSITCAVNPNGTVWSINYSQ